MKSLADIITWLKTPDHNTVILVEAIDVPTSGETLYLSNKPFITSASDTPPNKAFIPSIIGGISFNESLSLTGGINISYGDVELDNTDGTKDSWFHYVWTNKAINVYIGDITWPYTDFRLIFSGIIADISSRNASSINIILADKLQRLNNPISEELLPTANTTNDVLIPITFGEVFNITPVVVDNVINTLEYQVHNGRIEDIIEVRDNGIPVSFTKNLVEGTFTLNQSPYGQITCSVQGYANEQNLITFSEVFQSLAWNKTGVTVLQDAITAPDSNLTADKLTASLSDSFIKRNITPVKKGATYTFSIWIKADSITPISIILGSTDGTITQTSSTISPDLTWRKFSVTHTMSSTTTGAFVQIGGSNTFSTGEVVYVWGAQLEKSSVATEYVNTGISPAIPYYNDIANIINEIVTKYGPENSRLTSYDIDLSNFGVFSSNHTEPVGVYIKSSENILTICNQLANSIGAQLTVSSTGLLRLIRLTIPGEGLPHTITSNDIEENSINISDKPDVRAATKLGYCRNWTTQQGSIAAGIPSQNINLFETEWLYTTVVDNTVKAEYKLTTEPKEELTLLITKDDAEAEAIRRNELWSEPRFIYTIKAYAHLLSVELGDQVTLIDDNRFGLENPGKQGVVVNISRNWLSGRITLGILI